jgi:4-amino-4-deoxy-L-arabinose transferase-like glycosyltransferase
MMGCVIGASLIAKRLGGNSNAQFFAALATITLPMGVLQATSTQNDYLMALWCVCFAEFVLECRSDVFRPRSVLMAGAALGLAILTKVTAVLYLAPFGLWLAVELWRRLSLKAWKPLIGVVIVAGVILAPHSLRNRGLFGTPLGPTAGQELGGLTNEAHSLPILVSNIIRNLGLQLALPVEGFNSGLESLLQKTHAVLGTDMSDPRTTWRGLQFHLVFSNYEDSAGNPLHLVLLVAAVVLVFRSRNAQSAVYLLCLAVGFVAFCWLLKWQPWNSRLNLTLFVLGMPLAAAVWTEQLPRRALSLSSLVLALGAIPYLIANPTRPLLGANSIFLKDRLHQYFTNVPDSLASYEAAARMIHDAACSSVGLASPPEGREYLLWVTNAVYGDRIRIEHVLVKNVSRRLTADFVPCAIVFTYPVQEPDISYRDMAYTRFISTERFSLFLAATAAP